MKNAEKQNEARRIKWFVTPEKAEYQARILSNCIRNRYRHLSKRFKKQNIDCFRLYDWDIPEVRAVVDWYAGHVVIGEGAFTCAAAVGGAKATVTVDRSATYLKWAEDNLKLNGFQGAQHTIVQSDVMKFLARAYKEGKKFTLAVVDPPSFFNDRNEGVSFDINRGHRDLLQNVLKVMIPGFIIFFSTNHQRFQPRLDNLGARNIVEITSSTVPEDYRNKQIHRCWRITA